MSKEQVISLVIPIFNEAGNLEPLYRAIKEVLPASYQGEYWFVDDGSTDNSLAIVKKLARSDKRIKYLSFTRNFGHQYALKAGLDFATGDAVITLDADLQHPPALIPTMLKCWEEGAKIVYMRRNGSQGTAVKDATSNLFYRIINILSDTKLDPGSADFRLLDRSVVEMVRTSQESTLFLRGLVAWSGYPSATIDYSPGKRVWGKTNYSVGKMMQLAVDAVTSFSIIPLRLATILGLMMSVFTGLYGLYAIIAYFTNWNVITGWPSVIISVLFIGGLQLLILGIIGEYIGKIYMESKRRPLYLIKEKRL